MILRLCVSILIIGFKIGALFIWTDPYLPRPNICNDFECNLPDSRVSCLQFWNPFVQKMDQIGIYGLQNGHWRHSVIIGLIPFIQ